MGNYNDIRDIYDLLDSLRKRPGMYLGHSTGSSSFSNLITFVNALGFSSIGDGTPSYGEFNRWITERVDGMSKTMPWSWMQSEWGNDKAFEMFFELLDEYRTCTHVYLCRAIIREHKPNLYHVNSDGEHVEPEKPLEVCAAQFAPSSVYYLLEVYTNRHFYSFPYHKSVDAVKKEAKLRWRVPEDEWFDI
jgi:hypothetical protein